jgi:hypothetical protein
LKAKFGGMGVSDAKHLEELESENAKLKRLLQAIAAHRHNAVGEIVMKLAKKFGAGPLRKLLLEKRIATPPTTRKDNLVGVLGIIER